MSLYKRNNTWWIRFTDPNHREVRESAGTEDKRLAQEYHDKRKAEAWRIAKLGEKPVYRWEDAVVRWLAETTHKRSQKDDVARLRRLDPYLRGKALVDLKRDAIDLAIGQAVEEGTSDSTKNRYGALVRAILRKAEREWEWIERAPAVRMRKLPGIRVRWLTPQEAARLLQELPPHLRAMAAFTLATGLRESNVTGLEWSRVDLERRVAWVEAEEAKAGRAIPVPLNDDAMVILQGEQGKHPRWVFTYRGDRVTRANNHGFRTALAKAGITDFRWHDLRHTWASWSVMAGVPLYELMQLGGWSSLDMVRRYAHLSADHLAAAASRVRVAQIPHTVPDDPSQN